MKLLFLTGRKYTRSGIDTNRLRLRLGTNFIDRELRVECFGDTFVVDGSCSRFCSSRRSDDDDDDGDVTVVLP